MRSMARAARTRRGRWAAGGAPGARRRVQLRSRRTATCPGPPCPSARRARRRAAARRSRAAASDGPTSTCSTTAARRASSAPARRSFAARRARPEPGAASARRRRPAAPTAAATIPARRAIRRKGVACRGGVCRNLCNEPIARAARTSAASTGRSISTTPSSARRATRPRSSSPSSSRTPSPTSSTTVVDRRGRRRAGRSARDSASWRRRTIAPRQPRGVQARPARGRRLARRAVQHRDRHGAHAPRLPRARVDADRRVPVQPARERERLLERRVAAPARRGAAAAGAASYVVIAGWPQTIATSANPDTNFGARSARVPHDRRHAPRHARPRADDRAHHPRRPAARPASTRAADTDVALQPFDVLNLETGDFNADFTGSLDRRSIGPSWSFPGARRSTRRSSRRSPTASAAPITSRSSSRPAHRGQVVRARAHAEPLAGARRGGRHDRRRSTSPSSFASSPSRQGHRRTSTTTLPAPTTLRSRRRRRETARSSSRTRTSCSRPSQPAIVLDVQASQEAAGVPRGLPGGDPSLTFVPPIEQWRSDYVLLTPDKYAFDFLVITRRVRRARLLDGLPLDASRVRARRRATASPTSERGYAEARRIMAYRCQLSFPRHRPDQAGAGQRAAGQAERRRAPRPGRPPRRRRGLRLRLVRELRVRGGTELKEIFVP